MKKHSLRDPVVALIVTAAVILGAVVAGCSRQEMGELDQVTIVKHRYVVDDAKDVVRVVGLARNTGELPTPDAEIVATLRSRTGSFKGQNRVALPGLGAGDEEQFALAINGHGNVESIELQVVEPGTITHDDDQADDSTEEANGDGS